jgi:hypothetical protein
MFQPRFGPVTTAGIRRRLKIDASDTSRRSLIITINATRFMALLEARSENHKAAA